MPAEILQHYLHKTIEHRRRNIDVRLSTSLSLFSSNAVDVGTNLLSRAIEAHGRRYSKCLDVGCGYGALGILLAASGTVESVEMVDRDALAVDFANWNLSQNHIERSTAHASLALDDVTGDSFDLIVSNLPGKAGSKVLKHILASAARRLSHDGEFWGVVVNPLWREIQEQLGELAIPVSQVQEGPRHTVFSFTSPDSDPGPTLETSLADVYGRDSVQFEVRGRPLQVDTSRGIAEFDALSFQTRLLMESLYEFRGFRGESAVVFNIGQGYVPLAVASAGIARSLRLVDRDLLALRTTERNLRANNLDRIRDVNHVVEWVPPETGDSERISLVIGALRGDEPQPALEYSVQALADRLTKGGIAIVAGGSTPITRMTKSLGSRKGVRMIGRQRYRGASAISFEKNV